MSEYRRGPVNAESIKVLIDYDPATGFIRRKTGRTADIIANHTMAEGYIRITIDGFKYLGHILAWLYMTGDWAPDEIDHMDGNRSNNRWSNLRVLARQANAQNIGTTRANSSICVGVSFLPKTQKYRAYISPNGMQIHLGIFSTKEEAIAARVLGVKKFFPHCTRI